ncbi:hypothetical protein PVK06_048381 [Gossypium arboreum]|uniref:Endonuclease/exonuclease/phosphatase domain-containing protein n=1 Tax=Gossypium arboreum TaxID=29729 RepID=A0ABR0MGA0_GOSAR|nr:hypothetical protein PVK06_048381 [Gossypium arboreum]
MQTNSFTHIQNVCKMSNCLVVNTNRRSGGLAMLWREGVEVAIQSYSSNHINSLVKIDNRINIRFTSFNGHADPNVRDQSWEIIRRIGRAVKEEWIVGEDFNAIMDDAEKKGGRRKPRTLMEDFREVLEELALVDIRQQGR